MNCVSSLIALLVPVALSVLQFCWRQKLSEPNTNDAPPRTKYIFPNYIFTFTKTCKKYQIPNKHSQVTNASYKIRNTHPLITNIQSKIFKNKKIPKFQICAPKYQNQVSYSRPKCPEKRRSCSWRDVAFHRRRRTGLRLA